MVPLDGFCWSACAWPACHLHADNIELPLSCTVIFFDVDIDNEVIKIGLET